MTQQPVSSTFRAARLEDLSSMKDRLAAVEASYQAQFDYSRDVIALCQPDLKSSTFFCFGPSYPHYSSLFQSFLIQCGEAQSYPVDLPTLFGDRSSMGEGSLSMFDNINPPRSISDSRHLPTCRQTHQRTPRRPACWQQNQDRSWTYIQ